MRFELNALSPPVVDAEIELTDEGLLRAAVFKGLRDDIEPPKR
jgi:hypothetical protein